MSTRPAPQHAVLLGIVLLSVLPSRSFASWPADPAVNVPVSTADQGQRYPQAVRDGGSGAIIAWDDSRTGAHDIYVQRIDGTGIARWTANGVAICTAAGDQYEPKLVADGSGGAILTWSDYRGAAYDIYAQRVDSLGAPKWTANGVAICTATDFQSNPAIVADGSGGAIITWADARSGIERIYAQRVNGNGAAQWTANGVAITNSPSGQSRPLVVPNGAGGAIVIWEDYRNGGVDIFGQRILSTGAIDPAWPAAGKAIALGGGDQEGLALAADASGGAFVGWAQFNGPTRDVIVHHVLASSALDSAWPAAGKVMLADAYDQADPALLPDGAGGVLVSWDDYRGPSRDIYAQHLLSTGAFDPAWPSTGRALTLATADQSSPRMVSDGAGGAIVTWHELDNPDADISAQHVTGGGAVDALWPANGRALATAALAQLSPTIVPDGGGGALVAWEDGRNDPGLLGNTDVYAQHVRSDGQIGDAQAGVPLDRPLALALAPGVNPNRAGALLVRFSLPTSAAATLELLDVAGRRVASHDVGALGAGRHALDLAAGARPAAGVYFVRLQQQGQGARTQRIVVLD